MPDCVHAWHLFVIRHPDRDLLQKKLFEKGIGALIHYPVPSHLAGAYASLDYKQGSYPVTERIASEVLSIPIGPHLTDAQVRFVCKTMNDSGVT